MLSFSCSVKPKGLPLPLPTLSCSCCVQVRNIDRCVYLLPREKVLDRSGNETEQDVTMKDIYEVCACTPWSRFCLPSPPHYLRKNISSLSSAFTSSSIFFSPLPIYPLLPIPFLAFHHLSVFHHSFLLPYLPLSFPFLSSSFLFSPPSLLLPISSLLHILTLYPTTLPFLLRSSTLPMPSLIRS